VVWDGRVVGCIQTRVVDEDRYRSLVVDASSSVSERFVRNDLHLLVAPNTILVHWVACRDPSKSTVVLPCLVHHESDGFVVGMQDGDREFAVLGSSHNTCFANDAKFFARS
jgi:hypothetical protein